MGNPGRLPPKGKGPKKSLAWEIPKDVSWGSLSGGPLGCPKKVLYWDPYWGNLEVFPEGGGIIGLGGSQETPCSGNPGRRFLGPKKVLSWDPLTLCSVPFGKHRMGAKSQSRGYSRDLLGGPLGRAFPKKYFLGPLLGVFLGKGGPEKYPPLKTLKTLRGSREIPPLYQEKLRDFEGKAFP